MFVLGPGDLRAPPIIGHQLFGGLEAKPFFGSERITDRHLGEAGARDGRLRTKSELGHQGSWRSHRSVCCQPVASKADRRNKRNQERPKNLALGDRVRLGWHVQGTLILRQLRPTAPLRIIVSTR